MLHYLAQAFTTTLPTTMKAAAQLVVTTTQAAMPAASDAASKAGEQFDYSKTWWLALVGVGLGWGLSEISRLRAEKKQFELFDSKQNFLTCTNVRR